jgi:hypothetical protein
MPNANNAAVGLKLQPSPAELEFELNISGANLRPQIQHGSQLIRRTQRIAKGTYDFAVQGGAIGNINLYDPSFAPGISAPPGQVQTAGISTASKGVFKPLIIPYNSIIVRALLDVITAFAGTSTTIAFSTGVTAADLKAATAIGSLTGIIDLTPNHTAANSIKIVQPLSGSQGVVPFLAVAVGALTAGKCNVHIEYYLSD